MQYRDGLQMVNSEQEPLATAVAPIVYSELEPLATAVLPAVYAAQV